MLLSENELYHFGAKGMHWGVRRYQNKDGSLTAEGRKRLGLTEYDEKHNQDIFLKKGTKASRVISTNRMSEMKDPEVGGSEKRAKEYLDNILSKEKQNEQKYLSVDGIRNSGRVNGKEFYTSWFTQEGYEPDSAYVTSFTTKNATNIASGKKVIDALIEEAGSEKISKLLKKGFPIKSLTLEYTTDKELFEKVNKRFADKGYDGVEDINDLDTDMPIIMFNSSKNLGNYTDIQTGRQAIDELIKRTR